MRGTVTVDSASREFDRIRAEIYKAQKICLRLNLHKWMKKYNIQHEAWGPLAQHRIKEIIDNPVVKEIAAKYGKTPTQVALRFTVQRGIVVIPKTTSKDRMKENLDLFDFSLDDGDIEKLKVIDEDKSLWCAYDDPMIVEYAMS